MVDAIYMSKRYHARFHVSELKFKAEYQLFVYVQTNSNLLVQIITLNEPTVGSDTQNKSDRRQNTQITVSQLGAFPSVVTKQAGDFQLMTIEHKMIGYQVGGGESVLKMVMALKSIECALEYVWQSIKKY